MEIDEPLPYLYIWILSFFWLLLPASVFASNNLVESTVRSYFKDIPVMVAIADCESEFKQYNASGEALRGGWLGGMVGVFQLFERVHETSAAALGFDIATLDGNLAYARHLYNTSGTNPWNSSKSCWSNVPLPKAEAATDANESIEAVRLELIKQIMTLMQLLAEKDKVAISL